MRCILKIKPIWVFLTIVSSAIAQQYSFENFAQQASLSESYVYTFTQDSGAYLWIGTSNGLFRFDGLNLNTYTTTDSLADNFVTCSYTGKTGVWFGHMNGSISFFDGKSFTKIITPAPDKSSITEITGAADGTIWAGTYSGGLIQFGSGLNYRKFTYSAENITIYAFRFISEDSFLAGSSDGLRYCRVNKDGKIIIVHHFTELPQERIQSIIKGTLPNDYFIATGNQGIYHLTSINDNFAISRIDKPGDNITDIQSIALDKKNNLWIGTFGYGLFKVKLKGNISTGEITKFNQQQGTTADNIKTLFFDRDENIWTGNYGQGISRISTKTFTVEKADNIDYGNNYNCIASDENYRWIGTENGLLKTGLNNATSMEFFSSNRYFEGAEVTSVYIQNKNMIWIGTSGRGVFRLNTTSRAVVKYPIHEGILENNITSITGYNNFLWVGTNKGACKVDIETNQNSWYTINQNGLPHNSIKQIFIDSKKHTWIVTLSNTLCKVNGDVLKKITIPSSSSSVTLESVTEDKSGNIWLGSGGQGLFLIQGDSILNFTTREGLFSDYCYSAIGDKQGFVWAGHHGGLSRINCNDFSIKAIRKSFNSGNSPDFINNSVNCDFKGRVWFGYNGGVMCYNPEYENSRFLPPAIHLNAITINNQEFEIANKIKLSSGRYKIKFDFIGISLKEPESVRYQYRLTGYDNDWSEITQNTSVTYPGLTEGEYIFEVNAASGDGIITPTPAKVIIEIKTAVWKSAWLYISILFILITVIFSYNKRLQRRHIAEKQLLEQKVQERTLEIQLQKDEIEQQRDLINKKNIDITDSLKYARKIQSSINPPDELLDRLLPDHFLITKPKDIVSGDFCWYSQTNDKIIVTVADCTGHGVPGAMMSILGINSLNEIIINYGITEPCRVMEFLRLKVITSLSQHSKDSPSFDGINLGLCVIDQKTLSIQFSGAINNMVHIQDGVLNVVKADRIPIGVSDLEHKPFTNTEFQGKKGDVLYLFSDGFQDQFGGEKEKKFSSKRFIDLLFCIHKLPMSEQKIELDNILRSWMRDNEQTDDITILGFRL